MANVKSTGRKSVLAVLGGIIVLFLTPPTRAAGVIGQPVTCWLESLQSFCDVMTPFSSPQVVVDPGVEFADAQFTPNAAGYPPAVEQINSFKMDVDMFADSVRLIIKEVPGSITGAVYNFGPVLRVNVGNLAFPGATLTAINQIGPAGGVSSAFLSSPTSVAIDLFGFSATTYDFQLETTVPEPASTTLILATVATLLARRRPSA